MSLPTRIAGVLRGAELRCKEVHALRWLLVAAVLAGGVLLGLCLADNLIALPWLVRRGLFLALVAVLVALIAWRLLAPLLRRTPVAALALRLERANPRLESLLVNSVLLGARAERSPMVEVLLEQAERGAGRVDVRRVAPWSLLRRVFLLAAALVVAWGIYLFALPEQAANAWARLSLDDDALPPLSAVRIEVSPGDCELLEGADLEVRALIVAGQLPESAALHIERAAGATSYPMDFDGRGFRYTVPDLREPLRYHVEAGDGRTRAFEVHLVVPPAPERITVTYTYPSYTHLAPQRDVQIQGPLQALQGTWARVSFHFDRPLVSARAQVEGEDSAPMRPDRERRSWSFETQILRSGSYALKVVDRAGHGDGGGLRYSIVAREDLPPSVRIPLPGRDVFCTAETKLALEVAARDDIGLAALELRVGGEGGEQVAKTWRASGTSGRFGAVITPGEVGARSGDVLHYYAVAKDLKGTTARSRLFTITVRTPEAESRRLAEGLASLLERIRAILDLQVAARERNEGLLARVQTLRRPQWRRESAALAESQDEIRELTLGVLADWNDPVLLRAPARVLLESVAAGQMAAAVRTFLEAASRGRPEARILQRGAGLQRVIEKILRQVLASGEELEKLLREKGPEAALRRSTQRLRRSSAELSALRDQMRAFLEEQRKVVEATAAIRDVRPQDFTGAELEKIEALAEAEQKWGGILMEAWNDLSKLYPQDFSNSRLCTELLEAYSEVELAADALGRKATVMAVPYEQSGLELAKSITENIERWLDDVHDHLKWSMEEPPGDYEVPMADLPEELEDLIGDLVDSEEAMSEETEDVTSGWMDSLNEGAGWTAMDGPISNMSAKGVTGNLLPNSNEIGGRSGEGRTGKSAGQMVEKTATGKGGRRTPTRYTADPFEGGEVDDRSTDPSSGSTGGGKLSGANEQGLRGVPAPLLNRRMQRLAGEQAKIRQRAERLDHRLRRRRFAVKNLSEALELMEAFESDLRRGLPADYAARRRAISTRLTAVQTLFEERLRVQREGSLELPRRARREISSAQAERPPEEYRALVEDYFRSLVEERR